MKSHPFSAIITDITSKFCKIKTSEYKAEGRFKIIDQGQKEIAGYTDDESLINKTHSPIIVFGDHTRALKYEDSPIALGADGAKALAVNPKLADARYIYYYLRSIHLKEAGYSRHFKFLKQIEIPIPEKDGRPNLDDQKRIAHLLGKVEGLIARRKHHLEQLDDLLKSVFLEMFGDPVRNEKGWDLGISSVYAEMVTVGVVVKPASYYVESGVVALRSLNIKPNRIDLNDLVYFPQEANDGVLSKSRLQTDDVVIVRTGKTGTAAVVPAHLDGANCIDLIIVRPKRKRIHPQYLTCLLNSERGMALVASREVGGIQKHFNVGALNKIPFPLPPIDLQNQFAAIVEKVEGLKSRYQQSLTDLETLYGALSQKAFKGELDLSRVPLSVAEVEQAVIEDAKTKIEIDIEENHQRAPLSELVALTFVEGRKALLDQLLPTWFDQLGDTPFSAQHFMAHVEQRAADLIDAQDSDARFVEHEDVQFGPVEYDHLKTRVFESIEQGRLTQGYDDANNRVQVRAAKE